MGWNPQRVTELEVEGVGTVKVSTIRMKEACSSLPEFYWETAILWPSTWEGVEYCADGRAFDIVGCDRTQEDATERHEHWCNAADLGRMAAAIVKLAMPTDTWHSQGWFGTWVERMASEGVSA